MNTWNILIETERDAYLAAEACGRCVPVRSTKNGVDVVLDAVRDAPRIAGHEFRNRQNPPASRAGHM